jgi:hypothetical protein
MKATLVLLLFIRIKYITLQSKSLQFYAMEATTGTQDYANSFIALRYVCWLLDWGVGWITYTIHRPI